MIDQAQRLEELEEKCTALENGFLWQEDQTNEQQDEDHQYEGE